MGRVGEEVKAANPFHDEERGPISELFKFDSGPSDRCAGK